MILFRLNLLGTMPGQRDMHFDASNPSSDPQTGRQMSYGRKMSMARHDPYGPAGLLSHMVSVLAPTGLAQPSTTLHDYSYQFPQARAASAQAHMVQFTWPQN